MSLQDVSVRVHPKLSGRTYPVVFYQTFAVCRFSQHPVRQKWCRTEKANSEDVCLYLEWFAFFVMCRFLRTVIYHTVTEDYYSHHVVGKHKLSGFVAFDDTFVY